MPGETRELPKAYARNICAYCGSSDRLTDDHIPPKNLFPKPRPANLITVSACGNCHSNTSKDNEYFRVKLCLRQDAGARPSARENWPAIFHSLSREEAAGYSTAFFGDVHSVHLHTPAGIYIGSRLGYDVDLARIRRVIERTVRGLYFAERSAPLGLRNEVRIHTNEDLEQEAPEVIEELTTKILTPLAAQPPKIIGNNVFSYRFHIPEENPLYSVWGLSFYEAVPFLCFTGPGIIES